MQAVHGCIWQGSHLSSHKAFLAITQELRKCWMLPSNLNQLIVDLRVDNLRQLRVDNRKGKVAAVSKLPPSQPADQQRCRCCQVLCFWVFGCIHTCQPCYSCDVQLDAGPGLIHNKQSKQTNATPNGVLPMQVPRRIISFGSNCPLTKTFSKSIEDFLTHTLQSWMKTWHVKYKCINGHVEMQSIKCAHVALMIYGATQYFSNIETRVWKLFFILHASTFERKQHLQSWMKIWICKV